jgi:predicted dehydrogenase
VHPFRLPIPIQPPFIEKALLAKKDVLSEKPVAMDIQTAAVLMNWYNTTIDPKSATWSVGENIRSLDSFEYARQEVKKLGRILNFRVKVFTHVRVGTRYFGTYILHGPSFVLGRGRG